MTTRIFCLPYAGGSARVYADWAGVLGDTEVVPVELPGRGTRFGEHPVSTMNDLVADLLTSVLPKLDGPYAVFGHSLGALAGYELVRRLELLGHPAQRLFVSGAGAPHLPVRRPAFHLGDDELAEHLRLLGGTQAEIIENRELMDLLLPVIRADLRIADTHAPTVQALPQADRPLSCPLTAFAGADDDEAPMPDVVAWQAFTTRSFGTAVLPGDHFFLHSERPRVLSLIAEELDREPTTRRYVP